MARLTAVTNYRCGADHPACFYDGRSLIGNVLQHNLRLVVGLGNPGARYEKTRHNAGFMTADKISRDFNIPFDKSKFDCDFGRGNIENAEVLLAKPMAYMNRSGPPIQKLAHFFRIQSKEMVVIHDDIDLVFGRLKIKEKGGHGGHNGIRSLMDAFGGGDFIRLRIGVGRSEVGERVTDHVLGRFSAQNTQVLGRIISGARDAVVTILCKGTKAGMNAFNGKDLTITA
ncbi:MAG: aminoacyl-tRNA hydrolase [Desulfobacterales bacterium]|jgi:PTH1 family peptidyl-tRNA hydrolase